MPHIIRRRHHQTTRRRRRPSAEYHLPEPTKVAAAVAATNSTPKPLDHEIILLLLLRAAMKESSSSSWFATRLLNAASTTSRPRSEKQAPPTRVGSSCTPSSLNTPSFSSSFSCQFGSPATSPSPFRSVVVIPFSWEKQPGVPKHAHHLRHSKDEHRVPSYPKLPLPPPIRSNSDRFLSAPRRKKRHDPAPTADPFALAMLECSREEEDRRDPAENEETIGGLYWKGSPAGMSKVAGGRRRPAGDRFGFVGLYGSCKTTCSVADSAVRIPRSGRAVAAYGFLARRAGKVPGPVG